METIDITEVARRTGLTPRALRFYEARGLVKPLRTASGRRVYGGGELARLHAVVALKRAGFSLRDVATMLANRSPDLGRLIGAQLVEVDARLAGLADTRALLLGAQSRIDRGEPIDVATLCSLIQQGNSNMQDQNWKTISTRYLSDEAQADFAAARGAMPADFDQADYAAKWADLGTRIDAALPLDPGSAKARAFRDEWRALLAPFAAIATPAMMAGVGKMYERMEDWQGEQSSPFSARALAFIKAVDEHYKNGA